MLAVQTNETWDYIDDSRMGVDTRIGLENNAGYTALLTAMNQVSICCRPNPLMPLLGILQ